MEPLYDLHNKGYSVGQLRTEICVEGLGSRLQISGVGGGADCMEQWCMEPLYDVHITKDNRAIVVWSQSMMYI